MRNSPTHRAPAASAARLLGALMALACVAAPVGAAASVAGTDLMTVRSADLLTRGVLTLSVGAQFYESRDLGSLTGSDSYGQYTSLCLTASYGATTWLELSAELPARRATWDDASGGSNDAATLDAPVLGAKLGIPLSLPAVSMAVGLRAGLPTGQELVTSAGDSGDVYITGGSEIDWEAALLASVDLSRWVPARLHVNVGWAGNGDGRGKRFFPDYYPAVPEGGSDADNDALLLRGAVEFPGRNVDLFTEFRGDLTNDRDLVAPKENMLYVTPGVRVRFGDGWSATGAVSMGMSGDDRDTPVFDPHDAYPDWAATLTIGYAWPVFAADSDRDGIPDFRDDCPRLAEDVDGFRDEDGCPDPDNDSDGVLDGMDGRPLLMEDYDGFEDEDGVPDLDNDSDGIVDERDMCPDEPEDLDGFEDEDGCPDQ